MMNNLRTIHRTFYISLFSRYEAALEIMSDIHTGWWVDTSSRYDRVIHMGCVRLYLSSLARRE